MRVVLLENLSGGDEFSLLEQDEEMSGRLLIFRERELRLGFNGREEWLLKWGR